MALLGYPLLVEPLSGLTAQRWVWTAGYAVYAALVVVCYRLVRPETGLAVSAPASAAVQRPPSAAEVVEWLLLAAIPSAFLLATTNVIASEMGSIPLVWVVPLALYLSTFIWTFRDGGGVPWPFGRIWPEVVALASLVYLLGPSMLTLAAIQHRRAASPGPGGPRRAVRAAAPTPAT